jgi:hypothetical protein
MVPVRRREPRLGNSVCAGVGKVPELARTGAGIGEALLGSAIGEMFDPVGTAFGGALVCPGYVEDDAVGE